MRFPTLRSTTLPQVGDGTGVVELEDQLPLIELLDGTVSAGATALWLAPGVDAAVGRAGVVKLLGAGEPVGPKPDWAPP